MTSPHLQNQHFLHCQAAACLKSIARIQRELSYAKMRAAADMKCWILSGLVDGWNADIIRLQGEYEHKCEVYAALCTLLVDSFRPTVGQSLTAELCEN